MVIRVPSKKLTELQQLISSWIGRKKCTRKELESLVGKLGHASRVVPPGKTFLRRMFELLGGTRQAHHHVILGAAFRSDLLWWATFLEAWNGVAMMPSVNRCLWTVWLWGGVAGLLILVAVALAVPSKTGRHATAQGEHFASGAAPHCIGLCGVGARLARVLSCRPLRQHGGSGRGELGV